jgi:hypothetical protein
MGVLETFCEKRPPVPIPNDLREALAAATHYVEEWCHDYWLKCPDATRLRIVLQRYFTFKMAAT